MGKFTNVIKRKCKNIAYAAACYMRSDTCICRIGRQEIVLHNYVSTYAYIAYVYMYISSYIKSYANLVLV